MKDVTQFHIRPARPEEAGLFYTPHPEEDKRLGTVGHVRMDFGRSGNEFWHTWWPRGPEELNSPIFKAELQEVVDTLRESVLKNRFAMERFCYEHGGKISGGYVQNYGYIVETEHYRYCLRCNPSPGDHNCYCTAYDLDVQRQNMARDKPLVGCVAYANGDAQEFTDAEDFLKCVREELSYRPTTGFRYEVLTDDPNLRKAVDDIVFDLYGEENPRQYEVQGIAYRGLLEMAVQEKVESNGGIITLRLIRCGVGANRALGMGITNKAFDAYEQSLIRVRAFLTSLRGWRSKTRPMKKSCLCAPCSPSCAAATQRNSSPRNISSPVRSGWRRINPSTRSSLRGGKRCFRRSRRCLPRGKRGFLRRLPAPAR